MALQPPKNIFRQIDRTLKRNPAWTRQGVSPKEMQVAGVDAETVLWAFIRPNAISPAVAKITVVMLLEKIIQDTGLSNTVLLKILSYANTLNKAKQFALGEIDEGEFRAVYALANTDESWWRVKTMALSADRKEKIEAAAYLLTTYLVSSLTLAPNAAINAITHMAHYINSYRSYAAETVLAILAAAVDVVEEKNVNSAFGNELFLREADETVHATIEEVEPQTDLTANNNAVVIESHDGTSAPAPVEVTPIAMGDELLLQTAPDEEENIPLEQSALSGLREKLAGMLTRKDPPHSMQTPPPLSPAPAFDVTGITPEEEVEPVEEEPEQPMEVGETPEISLTPKTAQQ